MAHATVGQGNRTMKDDKKKNAPPQTPQGARVREEDLGVLKAPLEELQKALDELPPEVLKEAKEKIQPFLEGDMGWLDLLDLSPEEQQKMAEMGYHHFQAGYLDQAEALFKGLTVVDPKNYYYHSILGAIYQRKKMWTEAVFEYSIAINENPADIVSLANRGEVYITLEIFPLAFHDIDLAIALDAAGGDPWGRRAVMLRKKAETLEKIFREKK